MKKLVRPIARAADTAASAVVYAALSICATLVVLIYLLPGM